MRNRNGALAFILLFTGAGDVCGQEKVAKSRVVSVGVFKNGLTVVKREVDIPTAGTYRLDIAPDPVYGTFWIASNSRVEAAIKMRDVDGPIPAASSAGLQDALAGKEVDVHLLVGQGVAAQKSVKGVVERIATAKLAADNRTRPGHGFLIVKTPQGYTYINPADISQIDAKGQEAVVTQQRPALILTVDKVPQKPNVVLTYLARGMGWAPNYRVDISDPKTLSIEMAAIIRNEMEDLQETDVNLLTGFPGVDYASMPALLSPKASWEKFSFIEQDLSPIASRSKTALASETGGMHSESVGKRNLKDGETLSLSIGKAKANYEPAVEWSVSSNHSAAIGEELWDVHLFKNPFAYAMTTGPVFLVENDRFRGQRTCLPAKVGDDVSLRIVPSVNIRTRGEEEEQPPKNVKNVPVHLGTREYRRATVAGVLAVSNQRKQPITMIVRRSIKGKVLENDGKAKIQSGGDGLREINPSNDIVWTVNLMPGEESTFRYRFEILLDLNSRSYTWNSSLAP